MPDGNFYDQLPVFDDFSGITDPNRCRAVPDDWLVVVADIEASTAAIGAGRFKHPKGFTATSRPIGPSAWT